jgi:hypothetical protein
MKERTIKIIDFYLNHLVEHVNLEKPDEVKTFIANKNVNNGFKINVVNSMRVLVRNKINDIPMTD